MPELLRLRTAQFELSIWCNQITTRQKTHQATLEKRQIDPEINSRDSSPTICFLPPLSLNEVVIQGTVVNYLEPISDKLPLNQAIFFENVQYQFEWVFFDDVESACLTHRRHSLNEGFRFVKGIQSNQRNLPARLTGTINTGNDVGWMRLPLSVKVAGLEYLYQFAFEVLPTKMDMNHDLPAMYQTIDNSFPLWRFSLAEKTDQNSAKNQNRGYFPLLWLANFGNLREQFEHGLNVIARAPHNRLQPKISYTKAERLKGKLSHRLAANVKENIANGLYHKCYRVETKNLSVNTPENRFIKMAVSVCKKRLAEFEAVLRKNNQAPDKQQFSDAFLNELHRWQQPLRHMQNNSFLKEVGVFNGQTNESLVLQQKTGYSAVYRVWQQLKFYLDLFAEQSCVSMKSVAEIYEVWCFLQIKSILENQLNFELKSSKKANIREDFYLGHEIINGDKGCFEFIRDDGVKAKLFHERKFTRATKEIRTFLLTHKPDIVLEVIYPNGKQAFWLFDAKYRLHSIKTDLKNGFMGNPTKEELLRWESTSHSPPEKLNYKIEDGVPDDAINQMHRYRDALIRITQDNTSATGTKSRPVFGAFALYPGFFDQQHESNPYSDAINEIGIGAFSMLPSVDDITGSYWLSEFLCERIGTIQNATVTYRTQTKQEHLYIQETARIPYCGMKQMLYPDLCMTIALGEKKGRDPSYFSAFNFGTAKWYHLPQNTFQKKYKHHIADEIRFLGLAMSTEQNVNNKQIDKLWPVKNVVLLPRSSLTKQQTGKQSDANELYYLFELGKPLTLKDLIFGVPHRPIRSSMKLTTLSLLEKSQTFNELEEVYQEAMI